MSRRRWTAILSLAMLAGAGNIYAGGVGTTGANILKVNVGSRQLGMGGVVTALPGDLAGIMANPSLLADIPGRAVMMVHWPGPADLRTEFISYSIPLGELGMAAGTVLFRQLPPIDNGVVGEDPVTVNDGLLMVSLGRPFGSTGTKAGVNLKIFNSTLGEVKATSAAIDVGVGGLLGGILPLQWGAGVSNLGNPIKHEEVGEPLPVIIRCGASWNKSWFPHVMTVAVDGSINAEQNTGVAAGVEWLQAGRLALRAGGSIKRYEGQSFSLGTGWRFRSTALGPDAEYRFDYAYVPFRFLAGFEPTHAFSFFIQF